MRIENVLYKVLLLRLGGRVPGVLLIDMHEFYAEDGTSELSWDIRTITLNAIEAEI